MLPLKVGESWMCLILGGLSDKEYEMFMALT